MPELVIGILVWDFHSDGEVVSVLFGLVVQSLYSKKKDDGEILHTAFMSLL